MGELSARISEISSTQTPLFQATVFLAEIAKKQGRAGSKEARPEREWWWWSHKFVFIDIGGVVTMEVIQKEGSGVYRVVVCLCLLAVVEAVFRGPARAGGLVVGRGDDVRFAHLFLS